jgi:hypothetical protein
MAIDFNEENYSSPAPEDTPPPRRIRMIDYDRGVLKMLHPSGVEVYMYWDTPGVYLNAFAKPVAEGFAAAAGFDILRFGKAKRRMELMRVAREKIEEQLQDSMRTRVVVEERGGYRIVDIGGDRFIIEDLDGGILTPAPVSLGMAKEILDAAVPPLEPEPAAEPAPTPTPPRIIQAKGK